MWQAEKAKEKKAKAKGRAVENKTPAAKKEKATEKKTAEKKTSAAKKEPAGKAKTFAKTPAKKAAAKDEAGPSATKRKAAAKETPRKVTGLCTYHQCAGREACALRGCGRPKTHDVLGSFIANQCPAQTSSTCIWTVQKVLTLWTCHSPANRRITFPGRQILLCMQKDVIDRSEA